MTRKREPGGRRTRRKLWAMRYALQLALETGSYDRHAVVDALAWVMAQLNRVRR